MRRKSVALGKNNFFENSQLRKYRYLQTHPIEKIVHLCQGVCVLSPVNLYNKIIFEF